jgi:NADPH:quinone reductase-like Zn-dependent oxidoreductase
LSDPVAAPGEVMIDVVAASVNAADWKVRAGQYGQSKFPSVPGRDFSEVVSTVGNDVEDLKIGDSVFGVCEAGQEGAYERSSRSRLRSSPLSRTDYRTLTPPPRRLLVLQR